MKRVLKDRTVVDNDCSATQTPQEMDPVPHTFPKEQNLLGDNILDTCPGYFWNDVHCSPTMVAFPNGNVVSGGFPNNLPQPLFGLQYPLPYFRARVEDNIHTGVSVQTPAHSGPTASSSPTAPTAPAAPPAPPEYGATNQEPRCKEKLQKLNLAVCSIIILEANKLKATMCGLIYDLLR